MIIPVGHLAFQAVVAFVVDNFAGGFDSGDLALVSARLAGCAALHSAPQPVENAKAGDETQAGAQWA